MIGIGKNHCKVLATIAALASVLIVNAVTIGTGGHIALARDHDNTKVFENSDINVQTDTGQRQVCKTGGSTSPISDSCTASSSNTISQDGGVIQSPTQGAKPSSTPSSTETQVTLEFSSCAGQGSSPPTATFTCSNPSPPYFCNNIGCHSISCVGISLATGVGTGNCTTDNGVQLTSCTLVPLVTISCTRTVPGTGGITGDDAG
jgi:hypothetical protein